MIYKTHKDAYLTVSERYGIDLELVSTIGDFYWLDVTNRIENFTNREIYVNKLGVFRFRKKASLRYIENIGRIKPLMQSRNRSEESIEAAMEKAHEKKRRMEPLIKEWDFIVEKYHEYKEKKYAYRSLQEQKANMGGSQESNIQE